MPPAPAQVSKRSIASPVNVTTVVIPVIGDALANQKKSMRKIGTNALQNVIALTHRKFCYFFVI
jgi:hypothetical protein